MSSIIARAAGVLAVLSVIFISLPAVAAADSANLITNPSFELGSAGAPTGWVTNPLANTPDSVAADATFSTSTPGHSGDSAATVTVGAAHTSLTDAKWTFASVPVTPGQYYTFSDWYKSSTTTSVFIYYTGTCAGTTDSATGGCWIGDAATSLADWNYFTAGFLVPDGVNSITVAHVIAAPGFLTTDDYSLAMTNATPKFSTGIVTLSFDDGWESFSDNATSTLIGDGLNATAYIITGPDGSNTAGDPNDGYMSSSTIQALNTEKFDIEDHSRSHPDLVHDPVVVSDEIGGARTDLTTLLAGAPVDSYAYPFGQYNLAIEQAVHATPGLLGARTVDQGFNFTNSDHYALKMQHVTNLPEADEIKAIEGWIDQAANDHSWLILMFHQIEPTLADCVEPVTDPITGIEVTPPQTEPDPDCTTTTVLKTVSDYLAAKQTAGSVSVKTMHDMLTGAEFATDNTPPVVVLNGSLTMKVAAGAVFTDPGVLNGNATDNADVIDPVVTTVDSFDGGPTTTPLTLPLINTKIPGTYVLKYTATDSSIAHNVGSTTRTVIVGLNTPPVVKDIATSTIKNIPAFITLTGTDVDGTALTFATTSNPINGTLSGSGANLVYTASTTDFIGTDSFTFKANDGIADSNIATVTITVAPAPSVVATDIVATPGQTTATITWNTVTVSSSTVIYSTDTSYNASTSNPTLTAGHTVALTGLTPGTTYHFEVISTDTANNTATSSDQTFITAPAGNSGGSTPAPFFSSGGGGGGGFVVPTTPPATTTASTTTTGGVVLGAQTSATCYTFTKSLVVGSTGADVTALQNTLTTLGFYSGPVTGYLGALTSAGISKFQSSKGISTTGTVGPLTRAALNTCTAGAPAPTTGTVLGASTGPTTFTQTLMVGSTGDQVTALQTKLTTLNDYHGPITGTFGPLTKAGVMQFQANNSISTTGTVGPLTRAALNGQ